MEASQFDLRIRRVMVKAQENKKMNNGPLTVLKQYEQRNLERLQYQYLQIDAWLINIDHLK